MAATKLEVLIALRDALTGGLNSAQKTVVSFATSARRHLQSLSRSFFNIRTAIAGVALAFTTGFAAKGIAAAAQLAGEIDSSRQAFTRLSETAGSSADGILVAIRRASEGTISDLELMRQANLGLLLGIARTPVEFEKLVQISTVLSRAVGIDAVTAYEKLTVAIGRQSDLRLDDLGIIISVEEANKKYAASLEKDVEQLTKAEKTQAFLNATLENADKLLGRLSGQGRTAKTSYDQFIASVKNLRDQVISALSPALIDLFDELRELLRVSAPGIVEGIGRVLIEVDKALPSLKAGVELLLSGLKGSQSVIDRLIIGFKSLKLAALEFGDLTKDLPSIFTIRLGSAGGTKEQRDSDIAALKKEILELDAALGDAKTPAAELAGEMGSLARAGQTLIDNAAEQRKALEALGGAARGAGKDLRALYRITPPPLPQPSPLPLGVTPEDVLRAANARFGAGPPGARRPELSLEEVTGGPQIRPPPREVVGTRLGGEKIFADELSAADELKKAQLGLSSGLEELRKNWSDSFAQMRQATIALGESITTNLTDSFVSILDGTKSAKEAFREMGISILKDLQRIIVKLIVVKILQTAIGATGGGAGGGTGLLGLIERLRYGQHGGVFSRPTLISERGQLEAAVPLPNNRRIPVELRGAVGGGLTLNFAIYAIDARSFDEKVIQTIGRRVKEVSGLVAKGYQDHPGVRGKYR